MHCRGIAPHAAAGGEAEQALRIDAGIPSQPGERIWEGAGGFQLDGSICPLKFRPENGPAVVIGQLLDVRQAPALKAGGQGTRYTCRGLGVLPVPRQLAVVYREGLTEA